MNLDGRWLDVSPDVTAQLHDAGAAKEFAKKVIEAGAENVCFPLGVQWGDGRELDDTYRIPLMVSSNRFEDITDFITQTVFASRAKTEMESFMDGYVAANNIKSAKFTSKMITALRRENANGTAAGLHQFTEIRRSILLLGDRLNLDARQIFAEFYKTLNDAGITRETAPQIWAFAELCDKQSRSAANMRESMRYVSRLAGLAQGIMENICYSEYLAKGGMAVSDANKTLFKQELAAADSFVVVDEQGKIKLLVEDGAFMAVEGLLLKTHRLDDAKNVLESFNKTDNWSENMQYIEVLYAYYKATGDKGFVKDMLPKVDEMINEGVSVMLDAPLETLTMLYNALSIAEEFNRLAGDAEVARRDHVSAKLMRDTIIGRVVKNGSLVQSELAQAGPDGVSLRPSALSLVSLSHTEDLLPATAQVQLINAFNAQITPMGISFLGAAHPQFMGLYASAKIRLAAQGSTYANAKPEQIVAQLAGSLIREIAHTGTVAQAYSSKAPQAIAGNPSSGLSISAFISMLNHRMEAGRSFSLEQLSNSTAVPGVDELKKIFIAG